MSNPRTTDKYIKVKKQADKAPENEIRIRAVPRIGRYISYAATLLLEKKLDKIVIKASGNATKSACQIAEILRHRILGLHQLNILKTIPVIDEYEPKEEGLDKVTVERKLAVLEILLSLKEGVLDTKAPGYQVPLPKDQVQEEELKSLLEGGKRTGGERPRDENRPRGRGRGRGFRRGRYTGSRGGRGGNRGGEGREGGYGERREGGYGERREGGYRGERREGGYGEKREGGYGERREGGYRGERREGGYGEKREGGYGEKREGGYGEKREGGYGERREGGYRGERREGGYGGERREGGYGEKREGGYGEKREGGYGERREGGYRGGRGGSKKSHN